MGTEVADTEAAEIKDTAAPEPTAETIEREAEETVEQRLKKLDDLYQKQLITQEEYNTKRQDILKDI